MMDKSMRVRREPFPLHYHEELPEYAVLEVAPNCFIPLGMQTFLERPGIFYMAFHAYAESGTEPVRAYPTLEGAWACIEHVFWMNEWKERAAHGHDLTSRQ